MKRTIFLTAMLAAAAAGLTAQQAGRQNPYEGTSTPPPDSTITTPDQQPAPLAKPSPSRLMAAQPEAPAQPQPMAQPSPVEPMPGTAPGQFDGTDDGIVQVVPDNSAQPGLNQRTAYDPDGDIVHPAPLPPGTVGVGAVIRVRLLDRLSTAESQVGDSFHTRVASDVVQNGQVLIPAGAEIDGKVVSVSSGHLGGHGSMRLRPDTVILPGGSRYRLYAETSGTPGSNTRVGSEGAITPGSRMKKDEIEYGGAAGAGVVTGAILGGPGGALAGGIIGASVITVHLLVSHPQATLDNGTVLLFTLDEPLHLVPATAQANPPALPGGAAPADATAN